MNCEQCQDLISVYLDNELEDNFRSEIQTHLALCAECAKVCEDFAMILDFCELDESEYAPPPNSKALWCRINNLIENEVAPELQKEAEIRAESKKRRWQFSFSQVFASILGIALFSSLLTLVFLKNFSAPKDVSVTTAPSLFDRALIKVGLAESPEQTRENHIKEQQVAIEYWNNRVEAKRATWNSHLREGFDRNLNEINQVVFEYNQILQKNPDDDLSGEMLDSALNEKMELLREFAEL